MQKSTSIYGNAESYPNRPWLFLAGLALGTILLVRLVSLYYNTTDLFFDEAQYWLWGKEPAMGYFSKPPMLGWIIAAFTGICGSDSEFCVRLPSPIIHTGTAFLIFLSAKLLFNSRTGFWSAITFALLPGITLSSTLISTDVPLLFCWAGALWAFLRLHIFGGWKNAVLLGVFIGLGLMSKYAMAYFFLCTFLFALFDVSARRNVLSSKFALSGLIALAILSPNLWWNAQHKFITATHTGDNIGWRGGLHFDKLVEFVGSQFGVFGPILFAFLLISVFHFWREGWDRAQKLLVMYSLPVIALIAFQALMSKAYANWAAVVYVAASILVADIIVNRVSPIWNRISTSIHLFIFAGLSIAVAFSAPGILALPNGKEPFKRVQGWNEIGRAAAKQLSNGQYSAVISPHRHLTAELVYYLRHEKQKVFAFHENKSPHDHYQLTRPYRGKPDGTALLVLTNKNTAKYSNVFDMITPAGVANISSGMHKTLWFFKVSGYYGLVDTNQKKP